MYRGSIEMYWLVRDGQIIRQTVGSLSVEEWELQSGDLIIGLCGYNDIGLFNPYSMIQCAQSISCIDDYLEKVFELSRRFSSAFVSQVQMTPEIESSL